MFRTTKRLGYAIDRRCQMLPANRLVARLRVEDRAGTVLGAVSLLVLTYVVAALLAASAITSGGPGWLHLCVLCWCWNALKFSAVAMRFALLALARAARRPLPRHFSSLKSGKRLTALT